MMRLLTLGIVVALAGAAAASAQDDGRKRDVVGKLNGTRVTLDFKEAPIEDVLSFLREFTGLNFHLDPDIHTKLSEDQLKVTFKAKDLVLKSALKLMLSSRELTAVYREGVLIIQHKDKAADAVTLEVYDVRDLLLKIQDFPGPKVELTQGGKVGGDFVFEITEPRSTIDEDFLTELIKTGTGDRSWDENPKAGLSQSNGILVVTQTKKVHEEIRRLLNLLRQYK